MCARTDEHKEFRVIAYSFTSRIRRSKYARVRKGEAKMILFQCNPFLAVPSSYVKDQHCSVGVDIVQIFFSSTIVVFFVLF